MQLNAFTEASKRTAKVTISKIVTAKMYHFLL